MLTARNSRRLPPLFACLSLSLLMAGAPAAAQEARRILAEGSGPVSPASPLWVVRVEPNTPVSRVLVREKFGGSGSKDWVQLPELAARIGDITTHGSEMVAVLDAGDQPVTQWAWFSLSRFSYGPKLGRDTRILAMAGDRRTLWALGEPATPPAPILTTRPTTAPTTQPVRVVLHQLRGEKWVAQDAAWPADLPVDAAARFAMAVIAGKPTVAVPIGKSALQILQFDAGKWVKLSRVSTAAQSPGYFKVIELEQRPGLWIQPAEPEDSIGRIWHDGRFISLEWKDAPPRPENVAVTVAGDQIRVFYRQNDQLMEQRYRLSGERDGDAAAIKPVALPGDDQMQWITIAIMAVLSVLILNTLLRRRTMPKDDEREE